MPAVFGLSSPSFIIEHGGKYYLTLSVLEYDPAAASDDTLGAGVRAIAAAFNGATPKLSAVKVSTSLTSAAQTRPRNVNMISMAQTNPIAPDD
ncbi:hypothetical protein [Sphingomonas cavernae]|uniref:Uncharacterized protein n=1 Tax=Sphingomonas cavernae TaxID=2320861 RepID=A0A418WJJ0_9SPHN|nr:hypothetical protein [Sphingomonas cavernae]RJF90185.1 hypothetical protein D3876_07810 [Sphingomonas cavernae]